MGEFKGEIIVKRNIETCFSKLDFSESNMKQLDPSLLFHNEIELTDNVVGSKYRQAREDKGQIMEMDLEITEHINNVDYKKITAKFFLEKYFSVTYSYELYANDDNSTRLVYYTKTVPLKLLTKLILKITKLENKVDMDSHLNFVKQVMESSN